MKSETTKKEEQTFSIFPSSRSSMQSFFPLFPRAANTKCYCVFFKVKQETKAQLNGDGESFKLIF